MAKTVIWSQQALDDIDNIAEYISRDSIYHAQHVVESLFELADSIPDQSESGRIVPELQDSNERERFIYSYRLIYELKDSDIQTLWV